MMERINKYISDAGFCARREADQLVANNRVTINNVIAVPGDKVSKGDVVKIDGEVLRKVYVAPTEPVVNPHITLPPKVKVSRAARSNGTRFNQLDEQDKEGALSPPVNPKARSIRSGRKSVGRAPSVKKSEKPTKKREK